VSGAAVINCLMIWIASASRSTRTEPRSNGMPAASYSLRSQPSADAEVEASLGQEVDGRGFLSQEGWVAKVVVVHEASDAQPPGGLRGQHQRRSDRHPGAEVVGNH